MPKVTDPLIVKNHEGEYFVNAQLDHNELDIICEGLSHSIQAGLNDPVRRDDTLRIYGELYSMWEATTFDNSRPIPSEMIKKDVTICDVGSEWNDKAKACVPIKGYIKDKDGKVVLDPKFQDVIDGKADVVKK